MSLSASVILLGILSVLGENKKKLIFLRVSINSRSSQKIALKHSNCKLKSLNLSYNNFTDNAANDLGEALKHSNCKLESLYLRSNNFTKEGRQCLTDAGKQSNRTVFLSIG